MKGVILAGGLGTRLRPLTDVVNKHLLPVGSKPMLFWPIEFMVKNGCTELLIVLGRMSCGEIMRQVGTGARFGARVLYAFQEGEGGIADALRLAEPFIGPRPEAFPVILGDNIFVDADLKHALRHATTYDAVSGAWVFLKEHDHPELFGVAELQGWFEDGNSVTALSSPRITRIVEKPKVPVSKQVVTGLYIYDATVWKRIEQLTASGRGEFEITDLNNSYAQDSRLFYQKIQGTWIDAGTPELYHQANAWAEQYEKAQQVSVLAGPEQFDDESEYPMDEQRQETA